MTISLGGITPGSGAGGGNFIREVFTSSGNWTRPAGLLNDTVFITAIGGGGSGGGSAGTTTISNGANGGAFVEGNPIDVSSVLEGGIVTVTIGAGGAGVLNSSGNSGTPTSFGAFLTLSGGDGGAIAAFTNGSWPATGGGYLGGIGVVVDIDINNSVSSAALQGAPGQGPTGGYGGWGINSNSGQTISLGGGGGGGLVIGPLAPNVGGNSSYTAGRGGRGWGAGSGGTGNGGGDFSSSAGGGGIVVIDYFKA